MSRTQHPTESDPPLIGGGQGRGSCDLQSSALGCLAMIALALTVVAVVALKAAAALL